MRILLAGAGKVGLFLAHTLTAENHDVTLIDVNESVIHHCEDSLDVKCILGNGANAQTLIEAGVDRTDILIACTASDEINMLCCLIGKRLGAKYTIARIREAQYNESLTLLQNELGLNMAVNPERATALEISRLLRFPFASTIESFAKGQVDLIEFRVQEDDVIVDKPLKDLRHIHALPQVLYAVVERGGQVTIPSGDFIIRAGDKVHVAGDMVTMTEYFRKLGRYSQRIHSLMMLGGGKISYYLAKMIIPMGITANILEIIPDKAERLSEQLPKANIILGDGTDQELLEQEGLRESDAFIALCDRDEENLMMGLYAARCGVPKVIVKNNRTNYADIIGSMGLDSIVCPKAITTSTILRYVRARASAGGTRVEKLYRLSDGKVEAMEFIARAEDSYIGVPLKELRIRKNVLIAVIVHKGKVIVPFGNDVISAGDSVVVIACEGGIMDLNEVIRK